MINTSFLTFVVFGHLIVVILTFLWFFVFDHLIVVIHTCSLTFPVFDHLIVMIHTSCGSAFDHLIVVYIHTSFLWFLVFVIEDGIDLSDCGDNHLYDTTHLDLDAEPRLLGLEQLLNSGL